MSVTFYCISDLLCAVVIRADVNRMTAQNCAIVLAPNLVGPNNEMQLTQCRRWRCRKNRSKFCRRSLNGAERFTRYRDTGNQVSEPEHGSIERKQQS